MFNGRFSRLLYLFCIGLLLLSGCTNGGQSSDGSDINSNQLNKQKKIFVIKNFSQNAKIINSQIKTGIELYAKSIGNVRVEFSQEISSVEEAESALKNFIKLDAQGIIVSDTAYINMIDNASREYPKVKFAFIDSEKTSINDRLNLLNYNFSNQQIGFFMGLIAGKIFPDSQVLFLGAQKDKKTEDISKGIGIGLGNITGDIEYYMEYVGSTDAAYQNVDYANVIANRYYLKGYPLVMQDLGMASKGVFSAAVKNQKYVIGYGIDQTTEVGDFEKKIFISSVIKRYDSAAYEAMIDINAESVDGNNFILGCKSNAIDYTLNNSNDRITLIKDYLNDFKEKIANGTIIFQELEQ